MYNILTQFVMSVNVKGPRLQLRKMKRELHTEKRIGGGGIAT